MREKGITLIALVITIIVLLILAGVSIAMLTGENGILTQANNSKIQQSHGAVKEGMSLAYNEYQIEINTASNTKLASTETVTIKGEEEKALTTTSTTFLQFLDDKGYIKEGTTDVLNVEKLTGSKQALGNGEGTSDVYKIEEEGEKYVVNYYDQNGTPQEIWSLENSITLGADTGKEALILVYNVSVGDTIELPYELNWYEWPDDGPEIEHEYTYNFTIDWGDGNTDSITNEDISTKATHEYATAGEKRIIINGEYAVIDTHYREDDEKQGIDKLVRVEQWGTTGLKEVILEGCENLRKLATPTENSFKNLTRVSFFSSGIESIPDKMFLNCTQLERFQMNHCENLKTIGNYAFANCSSLIDAGEFQMCTALTTIGDYVFLDCTNAMSFDLTFANCTSLTTVGEGIFDGCDNVMSFSGTFKDCTSLTTIEEGIFDGCDSVEVFRETFSGCESLQGNAPELWLRGTNSEKNNYQGNPDGEGCFYNCTKLNNYEKVPDYWKKYVPGIV